MTIFKTITLALIAVAVLPTVSLAEPDVNAIRNAREVIANDRTEAYSLWLKAVIAENVAQEDVAFLSDIRVSEGTSSKPLSVIQAENPIKFTAGEVALLSGTSYGVQAKVLPLVLDGPATNFVTRMLQKFPKTLKSTSWVVAAATASYEIYKTVMHNSVLNEYKNMSLDAQNDYYQRKFDHWREIHRARADYYRRVAADDEKLGQFDVEIAKHEIKIIK